MENTTLNHWGIKGMRWGVRRYQNPDGSLTKAGKKRYSDSDSDSKPDKAKESYEEAKQRAIKSGSAKEVLKYKNDLTPAERAEVENRLRWEDGLKNRVASEEAAKAAAGKAKADRIFNKIGDITDYAVKGAKAYNMVANIVNAFKDPDEVSMPKISTDITNDNKSTRNSEKKAKNEKPKTTDLNKSAKDIEKMTDEEVSSYVKRASAEATAKKLATERTVDNKPDTKPASEAKPDTKPASEAKPSSVANTAQYNQGKNFVDNLLNRLKK